MKEEAKPPCPVAPPFKPDTPLAEIMDHSRIATVPPDTASHPAVIWSMDFDSWGSITTRPEEAEYARSQGTNVVSYHPARPAHAEECLHHFNPMPGVHGKCTCGAYGS